MLNRIIRILGAALCSTLLLAGCCVKLHDPEPRPAGTIGFSAGSALLLDDAKTKASTESWAVRDTFDVFGERVTAADVHSTVFDGVDVYTADGGTNWDYTPHRFWYWMSTSDKYHFVAVHPRDKASKMDIPGTIAASTHYDINPVLPAEPDEYDLMAATSRRLGNVGNPIATVNFNFTHLGAAVGLSFVNNSENTGVYIKSWNFRYLVVCGDAKATIRSDGNPDLSWINTERNASEVRAVSFTGDGQLVAAGSGTYNSPYAVMIPQRLDQGVSTNMPTLHLVYRKVGALEDSEEFITLKDIKRSDDTAITSWVMNTKYTYVISMRLDGGLLITVNTTPWETVEAETPGLLI